ncbi:probable galacturonosyltransferase 6 isoform X2 [Actinidia eriantha]|uniref:probable galacturonosyltransferase 6 isoform X2 n=1 Tax=Actinidia eriantha TaxID=165200 RepID=UPI00258AABA2|nr:probable galacturonosyltransferase 6 isoform X2 [Actinidia eriantha]
MKQIRRCTRIFILSLLAVSVLLPIFLFSNTLLNFNFEESEEYIEDLSRIKHKTNTQTLSAIEKEEGEGLKEPPLVVYKDGDFSSVVSYNYSNENIRADQYGNAKSGPDILERNGTNENETQDYMQIQPEKSPATSGQQEQSKQTTVQHNQNVRSQTRRVLDEKVKEMKDQLIRAKAYLKFAPPTSNSQLVRELKLRIKELERAVGDSSKDSDLSRGALQRMRAMEVTLSKASRVYTDCPAMASKLRAMTNNAEEQVRAQRSQAAFLVQLAGRTTPKGLHCLFMRLTVEYFSLQPEEREFPNQQKLHDPDLYHFAVFSDNLLACAVVVNSTISTSSEPEKIVFHVVTDSLNLPAMSMWFLLNPPGKSAMQIQSTESFEWLSKYDATLRKKNSHDPRYTSALNHLRFYLPDLFPMLNKIVFLDHDVVVQRDLTGLWNLDMKGKVNGAVETCQEGEPSFRRMDMFVNFSDPMIAKRFDRKACTWAFGMNVFDLHEWRRRNLTRVYHKYLQLGSKRPLWRAGSLPLGWATFYNHTVGLDRTWHVLGLGYDSGIRQGDIDQAAVIHYDGIMKPWLDIGLEKHKHYWRRHVDYQHPYLQQCNIHR